MRILQYIISSIVTSFLVGTLPKITRRKPQKIISDIKPDCVYYHYMFRYTTSAFINIVLSLCCIPFAFFGKTIYDKIGIFIFVAFLFSVSILLYFTYKNTKYVLYSEYFEYYNMFSKKKSYKYSECTYKLKRKSFKIYCNNKFACKMSYDKYKIIERIDKSKLGIDAKK